MIKTITLFELKKNSLYKFENLSGKVLKIIVKVNKYFPEMHVKIQSENQEILADDNLKAVNTAFYPIQTLLAHENGRFMDYHVVDGTIFIETSGISADGYIDYIKIFLEQ